MSRAQPQQEAPARQAFTIDRDAPSIALNLPVAISFSCHGRRFSAVARETPDGAVVTVTGFVGAIPFSAESPEARALTRAILARRPSSEIVRLELADRNRIALRGEAPLGDHPSPARAVAVACAMLSAAKPLIDILAECGAVPQPVARTDDGEAAAVG